MSPPWDYDELVGDEDADDEEEGMDGASVLGYDVLGHEEDYSEEVGRRRRRRRRRGRRGKRGRLLLPSKPGWRRGMVAPGVVAPYQGLQPLPLVPLTDAGVFLPGGATSIEFRGEPQRPFRGERVLADIRRSAGATAVGVFAAAIFVGTDLQTVDVGNVALDFFTANAFGVRLSLMQAQPGMKLRIIAATSIAVPLGESVALNLVILGHSISA